MQAKHEIQTFKNLVVTLHSDMNHNFPKQAGHHIIEHIIVTVNMVRLSRLNPKISVYMQLHGSFAFNKTLLVSTDCKIIIHDRTNEQPFLDNHGSQGLYLRQAFHHYRNYVCSMNKIKTLQTSITVVFPNHVY